MPNTLDIDHRRSHLPPAPLRHVARWILPYERFWNGRLDRLQDFFAAENEQPE
ncbi:MAG TPA: hypothetical protein VKR61_10455 [Bryobacteraceae bacterium]|nr:hypothetical protein [Bryobacteraceae bacterium]